MVISLVHTDGQTPLDPDELAGLKPKHLTMQAQLNEWEQHNILKGQRWGFKQRDRAFLEEGFVRDLDRRMFSDTWPWAGTFRNSDKSIGVPWERIATSLHQLLGNVQAQIEYRAFANPDELALRFHRDLVWIHPFPNGNGRHARLMADLLITRQGSKPFSWGASGNLVAAGQARTDYIAALRSADAGDFAPLLGFARS